MAISALCFYVSSSRKRHDFCCFCCRGGVDGDGNFVVVGSCGSGDNGGGGGGNCCCCRSCSCWWGVLAYHHTRRLGVSQSSSASWTATKNTLYHLNTQTLVKSWSEFQENNRNILDNFLSFTLPLSIFHTFHSHIPHFRFSSRSFLFNSKNHFILVSLSLLMPLTYPSHSNTRRLIDLNLPLPWLNLNCFQCCKSVSN